MGISLTPEEHATMLGTHGEGVLTTVTAAGRAIPLPVWYVVVDYHIHIRTPRSAKRLSHIRVNPRVSFLVHGGQAWRELRGLLLDATAVIVNDSDETIRISDILNERFADLLPPPLPGAVAQHYAETVILRLEPRADPLSWDNRKIRL